MVLSQKRFGLVLWHIKHYYLFNAKSYFLHPNMYDLQTRFYDNVFRCA